MRQRFHRVPSWNDYQGPPTSQLTVVYPKMPNTSSLVNTRTTLVNARPSPSVGNAIRSQSLVNSRHHSSNAHASAPVPTSPLPSRMSPIVMQILLQTIRPTLVISRQTLVISRTTLIRALMSSRRPSHPENPPNHANPDSDNRSTLMISRVTHLNTLHTLIRVLVCSRRPCHPENPQNPANPDSDNCPNARDLSYNTRTSTRLFPAPQHLSPPPSVSGKAASQAPPLVLTRPHPRRTNREPNNIGLWLSCKTQQKTRKCVTSPIVMRDKRRMEQ